MNKTVNRGFARKTAVALLAVLFTLASFELTAQQASPDSPVFGIGSPSRATDLPASPFRSRLESLPANAQNTALKWLQSFEFAAEDIESLRIDDQGGIYYADSILPDPLEKPEPVQRAAPAATLNDVFLLHSKPGAPNRVFIDFDGHVIRNSAWNGGQAQYDAVPYDLDGDPTDFNSTERDRMANIWHRVAEDLAPFDIDVTTEEPVTFDQFTGHILVTRSYDAKFNNMPSSGGGGVAYVGVFGNGNYHTWYSPALVYYDHLGGGGETYVAEASSHEFGHNLGLSHDGAPGTTYYGGHGSGLVSWAPIMGNSYNRNVTQWSKGEYTNANQTQDDLAIIASELSYQPDDHDDVRATATPLDVDSDGTIQVSNPETDPHNVYSANKGVINDGTDTDFFSFQSGTGTLTIDANPAWDAWTRATSRRGANLDIEMELQNSSGTMLVVDEPPPSSGHIDTKATISNWTINTAGTYYLAVTGVGNTVTPYSDYDSLGRYFIFGSVPDFNTDNDPPSPTTMTWASPPAAASSSTITMTATTAIAEVSVEYNFQCTAGGIMCRDSGWQPGTTHVATGLRAGVQYSYQVIARDQDQNETNPSVVASATPPQDPLGAPYGLTAAPFSPFRIDVEWNDNSSGETSFRLERSPDGATWAEIGNTGAGVETYTDNSVNRYTAYYYRARAFDGSSYSGYSNRWGTATPDTLPLAPGNLLVSPDTATSLELDWDDNSDNETAFRIERSPNGTDSWAEIDTVGSNITTYTDMGLSTFTAYWYRVRSTNTAGDSAYSNIGMSSTGPVPPDPSFTFICDLFMCVFTDTSTDSDGTVEAWDWDFGDSSTSTVRSPVHAFPSTGLYEVSLTATDDDSNTDTISQFVNVLGVTALTSVDGQVSTGNDDVEEFLTDTSGLEGYVWLNSTDIDLIYDTSNSYGDMLVGLRFNNLDIPQGATITDAYIRFTAAGSNSGSSSLSFTAQDIDNAQAFSGNTINFNLTSRTFTSASVAWNSVPAWTSGQTYDSPDLSTVVQEVVNRPGWAANNSMVFAVSGTSGGIRRARSYNGNSADAARLHIEYGSFATPCTANRSIQADIWESFSLPCDPGSANKVEDVFENLVSGGAVYDTDWFVWRYDASSDTYYKMAVDEAMSPGQGYWIYTQVPTTVDYTGTKNQTGDLALTANTTTGLLNYIGHTENADKPWADFKAAHGPTLVNIPGADAWNDPPANTMTECALGPPSVLCLVSRTAYVWKAGNWQTFDAHVPGLDDDVEAGYGVFVRAFRPGAMLRIEDGPAPSPPAPESVFASTDSAGHNSGVSTRKDKKPRLTDPWMIRLIADAGVLQDRSNVLGQLANSVDGKDSNDIPELEPFGSRYLSLTFENEALGVSDWGHTSDYRALSQKPAGEWPVMIRASTDVQEISLSWEGDSSLFKKAYLRDEQTGKTIRVRADASYVFTNADGENRFTFIIK